MFLFQRIISNDNQWMRPSTGRLGVKGESDYVRRNGFGHEDWNFNKNLLIDGSVNGYIYYKPANTKQKQSFNVAFSVYQDSQWLLVGFYFGALFVEKPKANIDVLKNKMKDLKKLGNDLGSDWSMLDAKSFIKKLKEDAELLHWRVNPNDVVSLPEPQVIPTDIFDPGSYRFANPTEISRCTFEDLCGLAALAKPDIVNRDLEFVEGSCLERMHKFRERNVLLIKKVKDSMKRKNGNLSCQICGFDFYEKYGALGEDYIEAHHVVPLCDLRRETRTKVDDIALVCSNCHKMLHRKRPWASMKDLKSIIAS